MNTSTTKHYYGTCKESFKERDNNHTHHHLKINRGKKVQSFQLHMGIERK